MPVLIKTHSDIVRFFQLLKMIFLESLSSPLLWITIRNDDLEEYHKEG